MLSSFLIALAFLAGVLLVIGANLVIVDLFQREQREIHERLEEELLAQQRELARSSALGGRDLARMSDEAQAEFGSGRKSLKERINDMVAQSGKEYQFGQVVAAGAFCTIGGGLLLGFLTGSIFVAIFFGAMCGSLPLLFIYMMRERRLEMLRSQLPDAFDLMARVLRAGQTMAQAMASVAEEFKAPVSVEFSYCYEQQNLGLAPEVALRELARRTGLIELKIFVLAMLVHRQTGGNLAELLDKLSAIVRSRFRLRSKVKSVTAEGRMQGLVLLALPVFVYAAMMVVNRPYAVKLLELPVLLGGTLTMMVLGAIWIRKIVNFDF